MSKKMNTFASEVRERAVLVGLDLEPDHPAAWGAVVSIVKKIGCASQTLHEWLKIDSKKRAGVLNEVADNLKTLHLPTHESDAPPRVRLTCRARTCEF